MALESPTYISDLVATNPTSSDPKSDGDNHIRNVKSALQATFPNVTGAVTPTHTELNYVDGVTSAIQTQLNTEASTRATADTTENTRALAAEALLAPKASPTFTGTVTLPATGSGSTEAVRKDYADALAFSSALPGQAGNAGKYVTTDGTSASWVEIADEVPSQTGNSGKYLTTDGTDTSWGTVDVAGGASSTSSAVDITLTSASSRVQSITMSASGKSVNLPDATTLSEGGPTFIINATAASNTFTIRDGAGNAITTVAAKGAVIVNLVSNGTAAGTWSCKAFASITELIAGTAVVGNAVVSSHIRISPITTTQAVVAYRDESSNTLKAGVITVSGGVVSFGTLTQISASNPIYIAIATLSATQCIVTYQRPSTTFLEAVVVNISGTTVTAGTVLVVNAVASTDISVAALSATQAVCVYQDATGSRGAAVTLNVSGSTITAGAIVQVLAASVGFTSITALSSTKAIAAWRRNSTLALNAVILDVSGTTITPATVAIGGAANGGYVSIATLTSTKAICTYSDASSYLSAVVLDVSGSTITAGTVLTVNAVGSAWVSLTALNSTTAICSYNASSFGWFVQLNISGSTITSGTPTNSGVANAVYTSICSLSGNRMISAVSGVSSYLNAQALENTVSV